MVLIFFFVVGYCKMFIRLKVYWVSIVVILNYNIYLNNSELLLKNV